MVLQQIRENVTRWYVTNIIYPKLHAIDSPGFVVTQLSRGGSRSYRRELFVPEPALAEAEKKIAALGAKGRAALYSAGKKFGYSFAEALRVPTVSTASEKEVEEFAKILIMFVGAMWAKSAEKFDVEVGKKRFELLLNDFVVCSLNGVGLFLSEGGIAGIWAKMMEDPSIEGVQLECEGRKAKQCRVLCAPAKMLRAQKIPFNVEAKPGDGKVDEDVYRAINAVRPAGYAKHSMKELIDSGFFKYEGRTLEFGGDRYFPCEASFAELLEEELARVPKGNEALFEACRAFGEKVGAKVNGNPAMFITDYLSALGWGDVLVEEKKGKVSVCARYYPWSPGTEKSGFVFFRGLASGLVSAAFRKKIVYAKASQVLQGDVFLVTLGEVQK